MSGTTSATPADTVDRSLCGWRVRASSGLAVLPQWDGNPLAPVDLVVEYAAVRPMVDAGPTSLGVAGDGTVAVHVPDAGRFLVSARHVVCDVCPTASPEAMRTAIFGPVLGALCVQRGLLPFHANTLLIDGRTVAIAGGSGVGKSTLAAALARRGHAVISDDVLPVWCAGGRMQLRPANRYLRLRPDSLAFSEGMECRPAAATGDAKVHVPPRVELDSDPRPLHALVRLARSGRRREDAPPRRLGGTDRLRTTMLCVYRWETAMRVARALGLPSYDLSLPGVEVVEYRRKKGLQYVEHAADAMEIVAAGRAS